MEKGYVQMAEVLKYRPNEQRGVHPDEQTASDDMSQFSLYQLVDNVRNNPQQIINDPELLRIAAAWNLETVHVFHVGLGILDEQSIEINRQRRQEELDIRIARLHGDSPVRLTNGERSKAVMGMQQVLESTRNMWEDLDDQARQDVIARIEGNKLPSNGIVFTGKK